MVKTKEAENSENEVSSSKDSVTKKEIFGWAMFDFSNSGFTTVVITAIYGGIFTEYIVGSNSNLKDTYWSFSIILATLLALFLSPLWFPVEEISDPSQALPSRRWFLKFVLSLGAQGTPFD